MCIVCQQPAQFAVADTTLCALLQHVCKDFAQLLPCCCLQANVNEQSKGLCQCPVSIHQDLDLWLCLADAALQQKASADYDAPINGSPFST